VRAFALAPGVVRTKLFNEAGVGEPLNTVALPAGTALYLTSGRADWLSGRFVDHSLRVYINCARSHASRYYSANWDIAEVERDWKDAIVEQEGLVNKLSVPKV
jgi:hypothetical protein